MKLCATSNQQVFNAALSTDHPAAIPGPLSIKRLDTGNYIALRDILGVASPQYQLLEVTQDEQTRLSEAGITIAENASDLQHWYNQWDGPK